MKKIIILTASMGHGHKTAATTMLKALRLQGEGKISVEVIDFINFCSPLISKLMSKNYDRATTYAPPIQKFIYEITNKRSRVKILNILTEKIFLRRIEDFLRSRNPDILISTFPLWDYSIQRISKKIRKDIVFLSIVTDAINIHHSWILADTDYFFVSNRDTFESLENMGIDKSRIKNFGFPVDLGFKKRYSRKETLSTLGFDNQKFTVVFSSNFVKFRSYNFIKKIVESLEKINFIVLTGKNEKLFARLCKKQFENVYALGWRDDLPMIFKSADAIITKAGGASVMEAIAAELPMILTRVIPGQEEGNLHLVQKNNLGLASFDWELTRDIIDRWSIKGEDYEEIKKNLKKFSRPDASEKISEFVISL